MTAPSQPSFLLSLSAADACGLGLSLSKGRAAAAATPLPPSPRQKFNVLSPDSLVLYSLLSHAFFHYLLLLFCYSLAFFSFAQALNCFDPSSSRTSKNYVSLTFFNWLTEQFFHDTSMKERLKLLSKGQ